MATTSEVKTGLDQIALAIRNQRSAIKGAIQTAAVAEAALAGLATTFADVIATVSGYDASDAFEATAKAEFDRLVVEYTALTGVARTISTQTP